MLSFLAPFYAEQTFPCGTKKTVGHYLSTDKKTEIRYVVYTPAMPPHAILQIVHGMNGTVAGYQEFALFMAQHGVIVCGEDHIGHGLSTTEEEKWHFGSGEMTDILVSDIAYLTSILRRKYRRLPYILLGHSLGSFLVRALITVPAHTEKIDGAILMGTSAERPSGFRRMPFSLVCKMKGEKSVSPMLNKIFYSRLRKKFAHEGDHAWLSADRAYTERIAKANPSIYFTAKGFLDIFDLLAAVNADEWTEEIPPGLPLLLVSGEDDAVGEYGAGIRQLHERLQDAEICNLTCKLYPKMRHEILHDTDKEKVFDDLLSWIDKVAEGKVAASVQGGTQWLCP